MLFMFIQLLVKYIKLQKEVIHNSVVETNEHVCIFFFFSVTSKRFVCYTKRGNNPLLTPRVSICCLTPDRDQSDSD